MTSVAIQSTTVDALAEVKSRETSKIAKEAKAWFNHSPFIKGKLSLLLKKEDEHKFPEVYQQVIQAKKSEWRSRGQESLWATARSINTPFAPVVHKDLADITFSGEWGTQPLEPTKYEGAVTPFAMISPSSDLGKAIIVRNRDYDLMADRATVPTAAETKSMQTGEVVLILRLPELNTALKLLLVYLLTFDNGEHACAFKEFLDEHWTPQFERLSDQPDLVENVEEPCTH
jgi:hypothetical protein